MTFTGAIVSRVRCVELRESVQSEDQMRILIACETSGATRRAFANLGHDVTSVDVLPADDGVSGAVVYGKGRMRHAIGDVRPYLREPWDLVIAHPPCTYLTNSGVRWLYTGGKANADASNLDFERWDRMTDGVNLFTECYNANAPRVAVENPIMHGHARRYLTARAVPGPSCIVQPWQHGHGETKATGFWLRGLPCLEPTNVVGGRTAYCHRLPPTADRWKLRSKTYDGIARAMAAQWGTAPRDLAEVS